MCGRNGRRRQRQPLLVTGAKMAYGKYQQHQAQKAVQINGPPAPATRDMREDTTLEKLENDQLKAAMLESSGVRPPSYHEIVVNRAAVPPEPLYTNAAEPAYPMKTDQLRSAKIEDYDNLSDDEEFFEVANGIRQPVPEMQAAQDSFIKRWRENRGQNESMEEKPMSRREAKRARKAAKWEAKGRKNGWFS